MDKIAEFCEWLDSDPIPQKSARITDKWSIKADYSLLVYPLHVIATTKMVNPAALTYRQILASKGVLYRGIVPYSLLSGSQLLVYDGLNPKEEYEKHRFQFYATTLIFAPLTIWTIRAQDLLRRSPISITKCGARVFTMGMMSLLVGEIYMGAPAQFMIFAEQKNPMIWVPFCLIGFLVAHPMFVISCRTISSGAWGFHTFSQIARKEGYAGFYRGFWPSLLVSCFSLYDSLKALARNP